MIYHFTYVREQKVSLDISANNIEEATTKAWEQVNKLDLESRDDMSSASGDLLLEEIDIDD